MLLHVQTAAIAVTEGGRIGVYNPAAARVLGVSVDDVIDRRLEDLASAPPALSALAEILTEAQRTGQPAARREIVVDMPDGEHTLGYTVSLLGGGGATAVFFADITEALANEKRAAEAQRFAEVGRIAGAMAHELKSPLATVELYANLLRRGLKESPTAQQQLDVIKDQARLCLDRIRAIMHSIDPDTGQVEGTTLSPLLPIVKSVVDVQRRRHEGAEVHLHATGGEPRVALPENDIRSVVGNLVANALEATGGKGPVDVTVRADSRRVRVRVADKGPGLPDGDLFAAFFTTKSSGTGLGLWLVRRLVEGAGGSIRACNRRVGGAAFVVDLPVPDHGRLKGAEILVVEDDVKLRAASERILLDAGARVTAVACGKEVPREGRMWRCAILDYHLPDTTGIEIAGVLPSGTPVLLVSGDAAAGGALVELHDRRAWYLPKPFEAGMYLDLVSLLVEPQ